MTISLALLNHPRSCSLPAVPSPKQQSFDGFAMLPCSQEGWLEVVVHYTGKSKRASASEDEEPVLVKRFSGDSVEELTQARCVSKTPTKAATASRDGTSTRRSESSSHTTWRLLVTIEMMAIILPLPSSPQSFTLARRSQAVARNESLVSYLLIGTASTALAWAGKARAV